MAPQSRGIAVTAYESVDSRKFRQGTPAILVLAGVLALPCPGLALAQAGGADRGYVDGGNLVSHGVEPTTSASMLAGIERGASEAKATARGRASAQAAGLEIRAKGKKKPEKFPSPDAAVAALI